MLKLLQGRFISVLLEKVDHPATNDSVYKLQNPFRFGLAVGDQVYVVRHDGIGKQQEAARHSRFCDRITCDRLKSVEPKYS